MSRESHEIQNCTTTYHESIADEYLEDIYESLSVDETACDELTAEDLVDIDRTRVLLIEISKTQLKGGKEEEEFTIRVESDPARDFMTEVSKTQMKGVADNGDFEVSDYR